jgi:quercetin dioxygenase-like cupin family protein
MADVEMVAAGDMPPAVPATPGMDRRQAFHDEAAWVGTVRTERGILTGWHTHPGFDTYIGITSGELTIEFGPDGGHSVTGRPGDVVRIGRGVIHREGTAEGSNGVEAFLLRVGSGVVVEDAEGPA